MSLPNLGLRKKITLFEEYLPLPEGQEWPCPEAELIHEGLHHLLREGDNIVDTHVMLSHTQNETIFKISTQKIQACQISSLILNKTGLFSCP